MKNHAIEPLEARIAPATLSIASAQIHEGDSGVAIMDFTVTLTGDITEEVSVNYATSDGTATTADGDYLPAASQLTFTPGGPATKTISVSVQGDTVLEQDQSFFLSLSGAVGATIEQGQAIGTILSEELPTLSINDPAPVDENGGSIGFVVTLNGQINAPLTINYATANGTATIADNDYTAKSGTLTFNPGQVTQSQTITVAITPDAVPENDETFFVDLTTPAGAQLDAVKTRGVGTIRNDELVVLRVDSPTIAEGKAGQANLVFTVTLIGEIARDTTINYSTLDGTATLADNDYVQTQGQLFFIAGGSKTHTVAVPVNGDTKVEGNEGFVLRVTNINNIEQARGTGTIADDDQPILSVANAQVVEGDSGHAFANFIVTLSEPALADLVITYSTVDGTATVADRDYVPVTGGTLTIPQGATTGTIAIAVIGDVKKESNESFALNVSAPGFSVSSPAATATITDDDPKLRIGDVTVVEGDFGTQTAVFTVSLSSALTQVLTVTYATEDGAGETGARDGVNDGGIAADYVAASGTLTFAAGETSKTISVTVNNDTIRELPQNFFSVKLLTATVLSGTIIIANDTGTGTIIDNGDAAPTVSINDVAFLENVVAGNAVFAVTLSQVTDLPVTVDFTTLDGTAMAGSDFTQFSGKLTLAPGTTTQTISVPLIPDSVVEPDETFSVRISNAQIGAMGAQQSLVISDDTGLGTIRNDDVSVSIGAATLNEGGGNMEFTVTLSQPAAADVVVFYSTANGSAQSPADFTAAVNQQITILKGATSGIISIAILNDTAEEQDETFTVTLSSATNAVLATDGATATGTIIDDGDEATLSINDVTVTEGNSGTSVATFTVTLSAASFRTIKVDYMTEDGPGNDGAKDGIDDTLAQDYQPITANAGVFPTLTFAPGELTKTISVNIIGDTIHEALENLFFVKLFNARVADAGGEPGNDVPVTVTRDTGIGTIHDPGDALPALSVADVSVAESGGNAVFTVKLSSVSDLPVTVAYTTVNNGAAAGSDYTATSGVLTFDPNDADPLKRTMLTISVPIADDADKETDEQFLLSLSNPTNAVITRAQATGTILNDDASFRIVAFDDPGTGAITVAENGAGLARFKVILDGATPGATTTVNYSTIAGTAVSTGARPDFVAKTGTLVFTGSTTEQISEVSIIADSHYENDEQFTIVLSNPVNAVVATGAGTGTVTIANDDAIPTLTIDDVSILEGNLGANNVPVTTALTFKLKLSAVNERDAVTVTRVTEDGTAISTGAKSDYTGLASSTLTFAKGEVEKTVTVNVLGDLRDEEDQTFKLVLSNLTAGATFAGGAASIFGTATILDDDATPFVSISNVTIGENASGQFKVTLYNAAGQKVESEKVITVGYFTGDGTAKAGSDYTATAGTLTFAPGTMEQLLTVPVLDDLIPEDTETFGVTIFNAVNANLGASKATGTITDNDAGSRPSITINDISLVEGAAGTTNAIFTVSLSGPSGQLVSVNFATADGTAKSSGAFADYSSTIGTLTFDPNDPNIGARLTQTIAVPVIGDLFSEINETFTVNLAGAVNATIGKAIGTATILNGDDSIVGLALLDAQTTEGNIGTKTLNFTAQLSGPAASAVTFTLSTVNGTALAGAALAGFDYIAKTEAKTIAAGQTSTIFGVTINGDTTWETTESFFVNLTSASANVQVVDADPLGAAQATARGYIFGDDVNFTDGGKTIQWIDLDGDLVTLTTSKGVFNFNPANPTSNTDDLTLVKKNSAGGMDLGGYELKLLNFTNDGITFAGAKISITSTAQPGFPMTGDGRVDVGWIAAANFLPDQVQVVGIDLASVTVDGDLAKITAGDNLSTAAIGKLEVYSLGARGTATGAPDVESKVIGPISKLHVTQNIEGFLNVIGEEFGNIGTVQIDGALKGGSGKASGVVSVTGRIGNATIGSIIGGSGENSGLLFASPERNGRIGNVKVLGDIVGGSGEESGMIWGAKVGNVTVGGDIIGGSATAKSGMILSNSTLGNVTVGGDIVGGTGAESGKIFGRLSIGAMRIDGNIIGGSANDAGTVVTFGKMPSLKIGGAIVGGGGEGSGTVQVSGKLGASTIGMNDAGDSIVGGAGARSGRIDVGADLSSLLIGGNVRGGIGVGSGAIFVAGTLAKLNIAGSLIGEDVPELVAGKAAQSIETSGYVQAVKLTNVTIGGDIVAGKAGAGGIFNSGAVRAIEIGTITVNGNIAGNADNTVIISALGDGAGQAIKKVTVKGNVEFAEILAGYDVTASAANQRGTAANPDASLGMVAIDGSVKGLNIVAGASAGADGQFGTADDRLISGTGIPDVARTISKIAGVVIKGAILANDAPFGVIAQHIVSFKTGSAGRTLVPLANGAGNDVAAGDADPDPGIEIVPGSQFRAIELLLPA